jgi:hypothetical protein
MTNLKRLFEVERVLEPSINKTKVCAQPFNIKIYKHRNVQMVIVSIKSKVSILL